MFTIYNTSANEFNQWDLNQKVTEPGLAVGDKVVFFNSNGNTYPMKAYSHNGAVVVDVPNVLLTMCVPICVYINGCDETKTRFIVVAQDMPDDYVCVDNDDWPGDVDEVTRDATISELTANGQIGYEEPEVTEKLFECTVPADGSEVRIEVPNGLRTDCGYRATVDGKAYDCYVGCGEMVHINSDDEDYPVRISGNWDYNGGTIVYPYDLYVSYRNPNAQGVDGHVIVEMVVKEATIHTIDEKYLPVETVYLDAARAGGDAQVKAAFEAFYHAIMERKPVNPIFVYHDDLSCVWKWSSSENKLYISFENAQVRCTRLDSGSWDVYVP